MKSCLRASMASIQSLRCLSHGNCYSSRNNATNTLAFFPPGGSASWCCCNVRAIRALQSPPEMEKKEKPPTFLLGLAISATTEVLRLFNYNNKRDVSSYDSIPRERDLTQVQDVVDALVVDYRQAYFLTGNITSSLYAEDCYFADPTIGFTGRDLYERNLKLLVPFFEEPSLTLVSLNEESDEGRSIRAVWQLRTYLKLPWQPFIRVDGSTVYALDENLRIVRHIESWSISPLDAISQIFKRGSNPSLS